FPPLLMLAGAGAGALVTAAAGALVAGAAGALVAGAAGAVVAPAAGFGASVGLGGAPVGAATGGWPHAASKPAPVPTARVERKRARVMVRELRLPNDNRSRITMSSLAGRDDCRPGVCARVRIRAR